MHFSKKCTCICETHTSNRQVLSALYFNLRQVKLSLRDSANLVVRECLIFGEKARIPTKERHHCEEKIIKLYSFCRKLQKNASRKSVTQKENERKFIFDLNNLFDIANADALKIIKIEEDRKFVLSQRESGRRGYLGPVDTKLAKREERALSRVKEHAKRRA